jgi:hypothetical protein
VLVLPAVTITLSPFLSVTTSVRGGPGSPLSPFAPGAPGVPGSPLSP